MNAVFTPSRMRITVERYQKMVAAGVFTSDERFELIEGEILGMAPMGPRHAQVVAQLNMRLAVGVAGRAVVGPGSPVDLGAYSELQPDLMLIKPDAMRFGRPHPQTEDVLLVIEVADSSLNFDRTVKRELYARHGISEYWIVDVNGERIFVYRAPTECVFRETFELRKTDTLIPGAFPNLRIPIAELFV
jgi:Uma2 family endonuclease